MLYRITISLALVITKFSMFKLTDRRIDRPTDGQGNEYDSNDHEQYYL